MHFLGIDALFGFGEWGQEEVFGNHDRDLRSERASNWKQN